MAINIFQLRTLLALGLFTLALAAPVAFDPGTGSFNLVTAAAKNGAGDVPGPGDDDGTPDQGGGCCEPGDDRGGHGGR